MKIRTTLVSLFAFVCAAASLAQSPVDAQHQKLKKSHHIGLIGDGRIDSVSSNNLISQFYVDQFRHVQDPRAPYFMLMSRNAKMAMGIGGTIQAMAFYDWHSPISGSDFSPYAIGAPVNDASRTMFQTSIGQTALFYTMFGKSDRFGDYRFYIEAKFKGSGGSNVFKLNKAYATVGDWTIGYATSTFADPAAQPSTVETGGAHSKVGDTRVLFRYMHDIKKNWTMAVSLETPVDHVAPDTEMYEAGSIYIPNFAAFLQYGTSAQHVRLAGIVKGMRYRNLVEKKNAYVAGWGLNLSTVVRPISPVTLFGGVNYGQGIGSMVNDLSNGQNDLLGLATEPGKMYAPSSYGWYAAVQYNFRPNIYSSLIFSQERLLPRHGSNYGGDEYKHSIYGVANVFWEITPRCTLGAEFDMGTRTNMDRTHHTDYRGVMMARFNF